MYVKDNSYFYIGIHARNTRRLPFDVECVIGKEYLPYDAIQEKQLIMRSTALVMEVTMLMNAAYESKTGVITAAPMSTY